MDLGLPLAVKRAADEVAHGATAAKKQSPARTQPSTAASSRQPMLAQPVQPAPSAAAVLEAAATPVPSRNGNSNAAASRRGDRADISDLVKHLAKLTVANSADIRALKAIAMLNMVVEREGVVAAKLIAETKSTAAAYLAHVKTWPPQEKASFGPPHCFVWSVLITVLSDAAVQAQMQAEHKLLEAHKQELTQSATELVNKKEFDDTPAAMRHIIGLRVKVARIVRCWNPALARIELAPAANDTDIKQVMECMLAIITKLAKGVRKHHMAPKSESERRVDRLLNRGGNEQDE
eukprot:TRINITY_DN15396_c0_g1_i2.p2 TRINITY_DN15396_c0_g1~~TRINITY_DN15396_c0_g1_i2.p2  ORF type:complete len:292 (+),score=94.54 TRINITY_DN15396_c0_g1_i2:66-941(+)